MLILTRKKTEGVTIKINDVEVVFHIIDLKSGQIKIGLDAPKEVQIYRNELLAKGPWRNRNKS